MKLIDREPTQEMIEAMWADFRQMEPPGIMRKVFQAAYDAAPEIQQEPFGYVREIRPGEWKFSKTTSWGPDVWPPVYAIPPDAQAEIAKRDERIKELEFFQAQHIEKIDEQAERIKELDQANETHRELARISRDNELKANLIANEQAAEISRLKGVIAKCKEAVYITVDCRPIGYETMTTARENKVMEALAAIKEIDHATD